MLILASKVRIFFILNDWNTKFSEVFYSLTLGGGQNLGQNASAKGC